MDDRGTFRTDHAQKYLAQLSKHFGHKIEVRQQDDHAEFDFPFGPARIDATDGMLSARIEASSEEDLTRARHVIDDHLRRFAFREGFEHMDWTRGTA